MLRMTEPGTRVGAIKRADANTVYLYGWGTYQGSEIPEPRHPLLRLLAEAGVETPRIELDSGEVVYGAECFWGPAATIQSWIGSRAVEYSPVEDDLNQAGEDHEQR